MKPATRAKNFVNRFRHQVAYRLLGTKALGDTPPWDIHFRPTANAEDIFYCFRLILGRSPNREEWSGHMGMAGSDIHTVVRNYCNSLEFSRRMSKMLERHFDRRAELTQLQDFSIYTQHADTDVGRWVAEGHYEPHVTAIFRDRLRPGMNVIDIGANIGYFTMLSAALVGKSGSVTAIEPNPDNVKLLEASRRTNGFDQVTVIQAAAGREIGLLALNAGHSNGTTAGLSDNVAMLFNAVTVPCFRIDDMIPADRKIDFVKIDVEGAEYNAFSGAARMIERCHPVIVSEFSPGLMNGISGVSGPEYLRFMLGFGYKLSVVEKDGSLTACGSDIDKVMNAYTASGIDHIDILLD